MYCVNAMWRVKDLFNIQKKAIGTITSSPFQSYTLPLFINLKTEDLSVLQYYNFITSYIILIF